MSSTRWNPGAIWTRVKNGNATGLADLIQRENERRVHAGESKLDVDADRDRLGATLLFFEFQGFTKVVGELMSDGARVHENRSFFGPMPRCCWSSSGFPRCSGFHRLDAE